MSKKFFCPNCGSPTAQEDKFCLSCGKQLSGSEPSPKAQQPPAAQPAQQPQYVPPQPYTAAQPMPVAGGGIPKQHYMNLKGNYCDRGFAFIIDGCIANICPPLGCFRDIIPETGRGFGKSIMKLKVVDYDTGLPITAGQACVRNICFISVIDIFMPLCNDEGRRIGDFIANTIVLEDRSA